MSSRWVIDADHPHGWLVPMTPAEQAQCDADQAAAQAAAAAQTAQAGNAQTMRQSLQAHLADALTLADALDANTATPGQQRQALSLCLRGTVRLSRVVLELYDVAA